MKTVLLHEYKQKKYIADNLQRLISQRYTEISDEEFTRVNNAITTYNNAIQEIYEHLQDLTFTEAQKSQLLRDIEQLEADIRMLKQDTFFVQENGLYFTDENGYIGAQLTYNGFSSVGTTSNIILSDY